MSTITIHTQEGITLLKKQFEEQLIILNEKYIRWFSERTHPFTGETDHISNYFRYYNSPDGQTQLHLKDGLPLEIGKDCRLVFATIFGN
ncbi:hypothetical protein [Pedobacter sp.]|uniref:hypothetical protein n=1 Tax=Pedobacter sp. TaxID=1411316 RepID=UPI003D7FE9B7